MSRPHCLQIDACAAKGAGHCRTCWGKRMKAWLTEHPEHEQARRAAVSTAIRKATLELRATAEGRAELQRRIQRRVESARANRDARTQRLAGQMDGFKRGATA